ncbi:hypothetical protein FQR65_LT07100 [Abscondita terminalis]|nr:hypothetical protein FQR65_LT07100 [Abscondita terminalis]
MALNKCVEFNEVVQTRVDEELTAPWKRLEHLEKNYDRNWPWGRKPKPRALTNLRLEEIFPCNEYMEAKRCVNSIGWGRPGGGAPTVTHTGQKWVRTKEDPVIRFQWNNDLRRCVDNSLRYKTDKMQQEKYKKELDAQVNERRLRDKWEKENDLQFHQRSFLKTPPWGKPGPGGTVWRPPKNIGLNFLKSLGWSTEKTLKKLTESDHYGDQILKQYENFKRTLESDPSKQENKYEYGKSNRHLSDYDRYLNARIEDALNKKRLSPLKKEVKCEELVPILAKQRALPLKVPLGTTDVTRGNPEPRRVANSHYLQELSSQMDNKKKRLKEAKSCDVEHVRRHFQALDNFWGRPGNGAPRSVLKKGHLDRLLFNSTISVH